MLTDTRVRGTKPSERPQKVTDAPGPLLAGDAERREVLAL